MTKYYKATIELLIEADDEAEACDAISEGLRGMLKEFSAEPDQTAFVDWKYINTAGMPEPHDGSGFEYAQVEG